MSFGENIRKYRKKAGYSRKEVAEILGVSVPTIGHWENEDNQVSYEYLVKLKDLYGISISEMFDEKPDEPLKQDVKIEMLETLLDLCDLDNVKTFDDLDFNSQILIKTAINKLIEKKKASTK